MNPDLVVCPGCRARVDDRIEIRTLQRDGDVLRCTCGRRYPIVDGVPIVLGDPSGYLHDDIAVVLERDLPPDVAALLVAGGPDDATYPRLLEHLSIYLDAHWGDRADPPPDGQSDMRALIDRIAARTDRVALAVELGSSTGRIVGELARAADHVVGVDLQFGAVRRARHLLAGERIAYARRVTGRRYASATAIAGDRAIAPGASTLICGDALDPPLVPGMYDRVVALNLLDSVRSPRQLLSVVDGLCAPGGEVILSSPFAWQSGIVDDTAPLDGPDPAADLAAILRDGTGLGARYRIEDEADLPWTLRRDARSAVAYCIHYVRARKI
jgi:SAM-dependent methyltransferase/uncharacterized protein YbaR (Trm112 family)